MIEKIKGLRKSSLHPEPRLHLTDNAGDVALLGNSAEPRASPSLTSRVFTGSAWTLTGQIIPLAISFLATPFVIRLLGIEMYGVFILMNVILTYVPLADFGMSLSSTDFAARAHARDNTGDEADAIQSAFLIALAASTLVAIALVLGAPVLVSDILQLPEPIRDVTTVAIYVTSLTFTVRVLAGIVNSPQLARLRMDLNSSINAVVNAGQIVTVPIVLYLGGGLVGAVTTLMAFAFVGLVAHLAVSARLLPQLMSWRPSRQMAMGLLRSGLILFVASTASLVLANLEKFALTRYVSVSALAYYGVAFTLVAMLTMGTASFSQSLLPAVSHLYARERLMDLEFLYGRALLYSLAVFAPAASVLLVIAKPFFTLWAGEDFGQQSTPILHILMIGVFFMLVASMSSTVLVGIRKVKAAAILYWCEVPVYIALVIFATSYYGVRGAAIAWTARAIFEGVALWILMKRAIVSKEIGFDRRLKRLASLAIGLISLPILGETLSATMPLFYATVIVAHLGYFAIVWMWILNETERAGITGRLTLVPVVRRIPFARMDKQKQDALFNGSLARRLLRRRAGTPSTETEDLGFIVSPPADQTGEVMFTPVNASEVIKFGWRFGDGNTSCQAEPTHKYEVAGDYDVELEVSDISGHTFNCVNRVVIPSRITLDMHPSSLPAARSGKPYFQQLTAVGGVGQIDSVYLTEPQDARQYRSSTGINDPTGYRYMVERRGTLPPGMRLVDSRLIAEKVETPPTTMIVLDGDSTANCGAYNEDWTSAAALAALMPSGSKIYATGVPGHTLADTLRDFTDQVAPLLNSESGNRVYFLICGTNDILYDTPMEDMNTHAAAIIDGAWQLGAAVIAVKIPINWGWHLLGGARANCAHHFNNWLSDYPNLNEVIDLQADPVLANTRDTDYWLQAGVHNTPAGYIRRASLYRDAIGRLRTNPARMSLGSYYFKIKLSDSEGNATTKDYHLDVEADPRETNI
ncbi:MAG: oligosaccharide flippase family protein [Pyrinomonadaceae bacterium]